MLKQPIYYEFNLDARTSPSKLIAISHVDDKYSETLEVAVKQNDRFVYMGGATVIARMVLHRDKDYLLSDDVACSVNDNGNILIPFDNAVVKTLQGVVKIEVNITRDADELTLQFPLWVSVTGSILDNAEVTPESEGTIPDLLKDATDALEAATEALEASIASGVVNQNGTISFYDADGNLLFTTTGTSVIGPKGDNGDTGAAGADGYSPTVSTTNLDAQTLMTVTDKNGAHNFYIKDGSSVTNAAVDENGDLIISIQQKPTSSVHPTIHTLEVNAGHVVGADGAPGVSVTDTTINQQGHLIITLSDGTTTDTGSVMFPKTDIANAVVTLSTSEFIYDGNQKLPTIRSVMLHGTVLIKNQDYVVISQPETAIGDYLLIIQGIGDYVGTSSANWSIEAQERYVFGVMWDYSLSSPQLTRLTPQNDPLAIVTNVPSQEPTACVGNDGSGQSDFDNYMPWKGMRRYNYIDGQIVDFFDYSSGETFVYIPEFWSKIVNDTQNSKMYFYISSAEMSSFIKHPGSGRYVSRYECNDNFLSASGFIPKDNTSLAAFRTGITTIDNKHFQYDFSTHNAIELLYIVEFAHLNSQAKVGAGITSGGIVQITGQTDILTYHTGRVLGSDNLSAIQYRWVENLWGNVWTFVDGILIQDRSVYICEDPSKFSNTITNDYRNTGLTVPFQGWLNAESNYANSYLIPLSTGGSNSTYLCDNSYHGSGLCCLRVSNNCSAGSGAGLFYSNGAIDPITAVNYAGGRSILILGGDS